MAGLKDQRREHPGVRALEPPEPPGVPQFSRGETPASNSFGTPKPGDGVQMAGRHLDVRASRGVPPGPHGRTRGPWAGGAAWPRRCVVCFWGQAGRRTQLCHHERHPGISLTSNVTTADSSSRRPRAVVWGAEELGVGMEQGGGQSWPCCHGGRPTGPGLLRQGRRGLAVLPLTRLRETGRGRAAGRARQPRARPAPHSGREAAGQAGGGVQSGVSSGGWCAREQRWGRKPTGSHWRMGGWGQGGQSGPAARPLPAPGSAGCPSFPEEGAGSQSRHGAPAFGAPLSTRWCVLAVSWWRGGREAPEGRERELGEPLCREQSQRAS